VLWIALSGVVGQLSNVRDREMEATR
jgi:hypothetical protein